MINEKEAEDLMNKFIELREAAKQNPAKKAEFRKHENLCIEKFKYLISMKTGRYKSFSNHEDLIQEGYEALLKAMANFNPKKGNFFWWAHHYIDTRISRSANKHTVISYPLKVAKEFTPHKESVVPTIIEHRFCPDVQFEDGETNHLIHKAMTKLNHTQQRIVEMAYGIDRDKPASINKICQELGITRPQCVKALKVALSSMKENIKS